MNPHVSLEQAKRLKEAGYDQAVEKTRKHYIRFRDLKSMFIATEISKGLWIAGDDFTEDSDITERYAAPTVEEMMTALRHQSLEIYADGDGNWFVNNNYDPDLKEALVKAFEALKERS